MVSRKVKHAIHCTCFIGLIVLSQIFMVVPSNYTEDWAQCDIVRLIIFWIAKLASFSMFPQLFFSFIGLLMYNSFSENIVIKGPRLLAPFVCFRVVTRGDFPQLVQNNVQRNIETCLSAGLEHFCFDIVTDNTNNISQSRQLRETVVPSTYKTKSGALYKGRALQYCLEENVNFLEDDDWIAHLDEETLLTENSVNGILAFVMDGKHQFGQGAITYANEQIESWITTLIDSMRVADDLSKNKLQLRYFHKMFFSWKGSFMVAQVAAEKDVTFDNGVESSLAEDCFFGFKALEKGYSFDFIEGEMWEKSPFTLTDYIKQRSRWLQGIFQYLTSNRIPGRYKIIGCFGCFTWICVPIVAVNGILNMCMLTPYFPFCERIHLLLNTIVLYLYFFGVAHSFYRSNFTRIILYFASIIILLPVYIFLESMGVFMFLFSSKNTFQIINKSLEQRQASIV
ncbi:beta-1,4-mannosyltransferase egh-like [Diabrotica undecimpunctata]|uniref:beta-1,4-mannosyltransferase egh-like n=1 Tax=Diabrotica undecimpunctata TaxID=50387 RepID=UPI003B6413F2